MNFIPCSDNVIIRPSSKGEQTTASGLIISASDAAITTGTVVDVGRGHIYDSGIRGEMDIQAGDKVWYAPSHASTIRLDGEDFKVVAARNIFGYGRN